MKKCFMYIDDVVFVFRDIARQKPKSIFDHPFMAMLKKAHDLYGMKLQLNVLFMSMTEILSLCPTDILSDLYTTDSLKRNVIQEAHATRQ